MKSRIKNLLTFIVGWPLSILAIYFILKTFSPEINEIEHLIKSVNIPLFLTGILCFLIYYFLRSIIWRKILSLTGHPLLFSESAFLWATSEFKRYIPGNIWSFLGRSISFAQKGIDSKHVAKALIIELQIVFMGAIIASLLSLPFIFYIFFPNLKSINYFTLIITLLVLSGVMLYINHNLILGSMKGRARSLLAHMLPTYSPTEIFWLLFTSFIAFFFFGLGYYFSISAIAFLTPKLIVILAGFFVFSLLIGLISIITPTGLGIREGMITFGLIKLIPEKLAGFTSLFARLTLIFSEIIFLIISYIYSKVNMHKARRLESFIYNRRFEMLLLIFILAFNSYFIMASFLRHDHFYTGRFDLGNMDQTVWNTKEGRIFEFTNPDGTETVSRLAFHADFILILLSPLYLLWDNPKMLLIIQTVVVSLGAIFVYLLSCEVLKKSYKLQVTSYKLLALALSFSYLMNPSLQWSILYDFHAVTLATTFLLAAFYFLYIKKYLWLILFLVLAGITKEQVWLPVGLLGLFLAISNIKNNILNIKKHKKEVIIGFLIFIFSLSTFYYLVWHAIPEASIGNEHFALSYFNSNSDSPSSLIGNILSTPLETISKLLQKDRILYLRGLFDPVGYLALFAPWVLIFPFADLFLNLMSDKPELHQIYYQYSAVITPFIYIAVIFGIVNFRTLFKHISVNALSGYIIASVIIGGFIHGPLPWTKKANIAMFANHEKNREYISEKLQNIPTQFSISSTNNIGAHLTHREKLYTIPYGMDTADIIAFLIRPNSSKIERNLVFSLKNSKSHQLLWEKDGFVVFKNLKQN